MAKKNITEPLMLDSTGIKILNALRQIMISNLPVNDLVTPNATLPLSANMGKVLDGKITAERGVSALYDSTATYAVGDYAIYADALYRCNTVISTPEAFDSTKWDVVDLKNLNDGVLANASSITSLTPLINPTFITTGCTYDSAFVYSSGGYCKIGKIAFINFVAKINSTAKSLYVQLPFTLPLQQCISFVNWSTDTGPFYGAVRTDGQIILTPNASGSNYIISGVVFCN